MSCLGDDIGPIMVARSVVRNADDGPLISIVIPTYNRVHRLQSCLQSVLAARLDGAEIIVVDDGSTDDTAEMIKAVGASVRYVRRQNGGPSAARNTGIRAARGRYIAFMDSDDRFVPGVRERLAALLDLRPHVAAAFTDAIVKSPDGTSSRAFLRDDRLEAFWQIPCEQTPEGLRVFDRAAFFRQMVLDRCYMVPSITLVRRSALDRVGLFDERLVGYEEWDLFTRLAAEYTFAYIDEPGAIVEKHDSNLSRDVEKMIVQGLVILQKFLDGAVPLSDDLRRATSEKLGRMTFDAAYHAFVREDHPTARQRLTTYMKRWGITRSAALCWGATWLPPRQVRRLRVLKARLASTR
jgi:GT2 family glycosyltransferase